MHGHAREEMNVALTIKNPEVERLAAEVARLTGETKTHRPQSLRNNVRWSCAHRCREAVASRGDRSWEVRDC
jgi:hypothetical protein